MEKNLINKTATLNGENQLAVEQYSYLFNLKASMRPNVIQFTVEGFYGLHSSYEQHSINIFQISLSTVISYTIV